MRDYYKNKYKKLIQSVGEKLDKGSSKDMLRTFHEIIELMEIGRPNSSIDKYFAHPSVAKFLLYNLIFTEKLTPDEKSELRPLIDETVKKLKTKKEKHFIKYRILDPDGLYPNYELGRNNCFYSVQNQLPIIWTKNVVSADKNILDMSVINWLTRNELKLSTAIMCASEHYTFHLMFTGYNTVEIDWECLSLVPDQLKPIFLREYFAISTRFTPIGIKSWNRQPIYDSSYYEFRDFKEGLPFFNKLFDNFSIQNDLLLRTCNYFVKSWMHWGNSINAEEAIANNFFCLEGCLHLIQKKHGDNKRKLNFKLLKDVFEKKIPHGDHLFDYLQWGYRTRIKLVHPEPEWGAEWKPFVTSEDFYEYFKISKSLLNFILLGKYREF